MPIRLSRFEMPRRVQKEENTATATYTRFTAEPFEVGYARTIRKFVASRSALFD